MGASATPHHLFQRAPLSTEVSSGLAHDRFQFAAQDIENGLSTWLTKSG
jgi:hypothetical protein